MKIMGYMLALFGIGLLTGCASSPVSSPERIQQALNLANETASEYRVGVSDVLQIDVWRNPDLSTNAPVRPDGRISVPLVGDVLVADSTPNAIAADITDQLNKYIRDPQVSVAVLNTTSHEFIDRVRVTGAVRNPVSTAYRDGMTVLDLVLSAGGVNEFAAPNRAILYRKLEGESVAIPVKLRDILNKGDIATNYALLPGDIITVPQSVY